MCRAGESCARDWKRGASRDESSTASDMTRPAISRGWSNSASSYFCHRRVDSGSDQLPGSHLEVADQGQRPVPLVLERDAPASPRSSAGGGGPLQRLDARHLSTQTVWVFWVCSTLAPCGMCRRLPRLLLKPLRDFSVVLSNTGSCGAAWRPREGSGRPGTSRSTRRCPV